MTAMLEYRQGPRYLDKIPFESDTEIESNMWLVQWKVYEWHAMFFLLELTSKAFDGSTPPINVTLHNSNTHNMLLFYVTLRDEILPE